MFSRSRLRFLLIPLTLLLLLGAAYIFRLQPLTIDRITHQRGVRILSYGPRSLDVTLDLSDLPQDLDLEDDRRELAVPVLEWGNTTVYLRSISYPDDRQDVLMLDFDCIHELPEKGEVLVPHGIQVEGDSVSYMTTIQVDPEVHDSVRSYENAAFLWASSSSEMFFGVYLDSSVFEAAQDTITFHIDGFYTISYEVPPLSFYFEF